LSKKLNEEEDMLNANFANKDFPDDFRLKDQNGYSDAMLQEVIEKVKITNEIPCIDCDDQYSIKVCNNSEHMQYEFHTETIKKLSYKVIESNDLFGLQNPTLSDIAFKSGDKRCLIVIDENVYCYYGEKIEQYLLSYNIEYQIMSIRVSEQTKSMEHVLEILDKIDSFGLTRRANPILAIGGGVLTDIVGLAANLYRRNSPCIKIPSTLMGQIDAGIGVKTGVNFNNGKNRLGSYCCPELVLIDRTFLMTLNARHFNNGLSEILKIALIKDKRLFELLEKHKENICKDRLNGHKDYVEIMQRSIVGMLEELAPNLWEHNLKRKVDFGHAVGPVLEMKVLPALLHGETVAIDMAYSILLSEHKKLISSVLRERIFDLFIALALPIDNELCDIQLLDKALKEVVLHRGGSQNLPLVINDIGEVMFFNDITRDDLQAILLKMASLIKDRKRSLN
jgi:2-epi-5-epi-valiolone synthase